MRNISFALTTAQIRDRSKTVTRRAGWTFLKAGALLQPVVNSQGLRKGQQVETIGGPIRIVDVRRERLDAITQQDVYREGFLGLERVAFIDMFCRTHRPCEPPPSRHAHRVRVRGVAGAVGMSGRYVLPGGLRAKSKVTPYVEPKDVRPPRRTPEAFDRAILALLEDGPLVLWKMREALHEQDDHIRRRLTLLRKARQVKLVGTGSTNWKWALTSWHVPARTTAVIGEHRATIITSAMKAPKDSW